MVSRSLAGILFVASMAIAHSNEIVVSEIDDVNADAAGIYSSNTSGIPVDFWANGNATRINNLINSQRFHTLQSANDFLRSVMLTELEPPKGKSSATQLAVSKVDFLLLKGDVDPADALLSKIGQKSPMLFKRFFDTKLLLGRFKEACLPLRENSGLTSDLSTRVFCLAQENQWNDAELTLVTGMNLGMVAPERAKLLSLFLDPELEGIEFIKTREEGEPIDYVLRESLGLRHPVSTKYFGKQIVDLRSHQGWLSRIRAAETLARHGSISETILFNIYKEGKATASGALWDRVRSISDLDKNITCNTINAAWSAMKKSGLGYAFAAAYGQVLATADLRDCPETIKRIVYLHPDYETLSFDLIDTGQIISPLDAIVLENYESTEANPSERTILNALSFPVKNEKAGAERVLRALRDIQLGIDARPREIATAITALRDGGFGETAKKLALEYLILREDHG